MRDREVMTEPPPTSVFSQTASQSVIFDEYLNSLLRQRELNNANNPGNMAQNKKSNDKTSKTKVVHQDQTDVILHSHATVKALKVMERVVQHNADVQTYNDFRYFKDDDYNAGAFLLHLWTFKFVYTKFLYR